METEAASEALSEALAARGWCIGNVERVKALIAIEGDPAFTVDSVEFELLNMDLRSFGGRSLPDQTLLRKSSHLQGPKILQVASARDISRSSTDSSLSSSRGRLLRLRLTDGYTEITAIEYSSIPSLPNDIIPGTKVRLEEKCPIHNGILCLTSKTISMLGGTVQTLFEEWQINQRYSGSARLASRLSQESDASKPPPFEKLQTGPPSHRFAQHENRHNNDASTSKSTSSTVSIGDPKMNPKSQPKGDTVDSSNIAPNTRTLQVKPKDPERPKEVAESIPVHNQAAAQKLLQKMNVQNLANRHPRGRMHRGKEIQDDPHVITLAEWEKKKAETVTNSHGHWSSVGQDEDLARQLQEQFDLEDHVERDQQNVAAENIKLSMFNFERDDHNSNEMGSRGRGRGRRGGSRGRRRGRGRG
uniref:RecQ mediated genome instability protein 1 OB-fold domain-containing protein n=1 Tax=Kalanchoe fedtschenkoi TaxID=63787 RepID=A0A7N0U4S2_KALFE